MNAKLLRSNMEAAGKMTPSFKNSAHHIVLSNSKDVRMRWLCRRMDRLEIDVNSAENGIFLPSSTKVKQAAGRKNTYRSIQTKCVQPVETVTNQIGFEKEPNQIASEIPKEIFFFNYNQTNENNAAEDIKPRT